MNSKFAITISRQYGSGGLLIGKKLAKDLSVSFYDKELIEMAAKESGLGKEFIEKSDEKLPFRFFGGLTDAISGVFGAGYNGDVNDSIFKIQSDIIKNIAEKESAVFVGRCADYVLREHPKCINVFICADMRDRVKNISASLNTDSANALKEIEKNDKQRDKYCSYYTNIERGSAAYYHLCVNSSVLGVNETADFIRAFAEKKFNEK
ncbi:MAG: cytidylate kinase-like family protein [Endomicrobia bacterium]|nr:cytidylate kinase-like family protein [Endomicrobiia bacterium]MCL2799475.1 cytidylate kinase-like family protein [Endomicrobiia bacterium]